MRILVDADACPVKQIIVRLAKQRNIPVTMLIDTSHELNDGYSKIITVDKQAEVTVTYDGGSVSFGAGDYVEFPQGLSCVWKVTKPVRKHYEFR